MVIDIVLDFKDRDMYDTLSRRFIKADIFTGLIRFTCQSTTELHHSEFKAVARIFELCACHGEGISILQKHLNSVIDIVSNFLKLPDEDLITVKYPSATVLLDLTANEHCIEKVADMIMERDLFTVIIKELDKALKRIVHKSHPNRVFLNRFKDLMIGIVLNLTCNVESDDVTKYML